MVFDPNLPKTPSDCQNSPQAMSLELEAEWHRRRAANQILANQVPEEAVREALKYSQQLRDKHKPL